MREGKKHEIVDIFDSLVPQNFSDKYYGNMLGKIKYDLQFKAIKLPFCIYYYY